MHEAESVLRNETYKVLWDYNIQTDHLILARKPDPVLIYPPPTNLKKKRERDRELVVEWVLLF